jgi:SAM-dependent methyltransferase
MESKERVVADAFDGQAARFERAPLQMNAAVLQRLVAFARLPPGSRVVDGGCGPGLVAEAFLEAGHDVVGVDLSAEMIRRARQRCERFGARARFQQGSMQTLDPRERFDGAVSRLVLHHVQDPVSFVTAQRDRLRAGGVMVLCDHVTDPDPDKARWHHEIEIARDVSHERCFTSGALVDLLAGVGLERIELVEEPHTLDFDEWFDRGTPGRPKEEVRPALLAQSARGFRTARRADGGIDIGLVWATVRGARAA